MLGQKWVWPRDDLALQLGGHPASSYVGMANFPPMGSACRNGDAVRARAHRGHSLSDVDQHVCDAIQDGDTPSRRVAVGVWAGDTPDADDQLKVRARELRERLPRCDDIVFFKSAEHPLTSPDLHVEQ